MWGEVCVTRCPLARYTDCWALRRKEQPWWTFLPFSLHRDLAPLLSACFLTNYYHALIFPPPTLFTLLVLHFPHSRLPKKVRQHTLVFSVTCYPSCSEFPFRSTKDCSVTRFLHNPRLWLHSISHYESHLGSFADHGVLRLDRLLDGEHPPPGSRPVQSWQILCCLPKCQRFWRKGWWW
jgi:hypothetical protein